MASSIDPEVAVQRLLRQRQYFVDWKRTKYRDDPDFQRRCKASACAYYQAHKQDPAWVERQRAAARRRYDEQRQAKKGGGEYKEGA